MTHGNYNTYARGCRCADCKEANRAYHAEYRRRTGYVSKRKSGQSDEELFAQSWKLDENGCHIWHGQKNDAGYGLFKNKKSQYILAFRWAYRTYVGEIPSGGSRFEHTCGVPACVNVEHIVLKSELHGTRSRYQLGCRCEECTAASNAYHVERYHRTSNDSPTEGRRRSNVPTSSSRQTAEQRFAAKWVKADDSDCHLWTGSRKHDGYGMFRVAGKTVLAHRWIYEHQVAEIPDGMTIDHLCRVRNCVNVQHMEVTTPAENTMRGESLFARNARKETCPKGHPLEPRRSEPGRRCPTCARESVQRQRVAINAAASALGLKRARYVEQHGTSRFTAEQILRDLGHDLPLPSADHRR